MEQRVTVDRLLHKIGTLQINLDILFEQAKALAGENEELKKQIAALTGKAVVDPKLAEHIAEMERQSNPGSETNIHLVRPKPATN